MLTRCCCGCRLHTGGIILGWLGVVGSFLGIVILSVTLVNLEDLIEAIPKDADFDVKELDMIRHVAIIVISAFLAFDIINFIASAFLIFGTTQNRHLFLLPWLVNSGIGIATGFISIAFLFIAVITAGAPIGAIAFNFIITGISVAIQVYLWLIVYSLYKLIRNENDAPKNAIALHSAVSPSYPSYSKI